MVKYEFNRNEFEWAEEFYDLIQKKMSLPEWFGKICGIIAFLAVYFYCMSLDFKKGLFKKKKDKVFVGGIPVYDLPQV